MSTLGLRQTWFVHTMVKYIPAPLHKHKTKTQSERKSIESLVGDAESDLSNQTMLIQNKSKKFQCKICEHSGSQRHNF